MEADFDNITFEITNGKGPLDVCFLTENIPAEVNSFLNNNNFHSPNCSFIYGFFKNRNRKINGCIIHNFEYTNKEPFVPKNAPLGLLIIDSKPFFINSAYETKQPIPRSFKFPRPVKIESNL